MIGRDQQTIKNDSGGAFRTTPPVRLSAMMVDLSTRHDRADPHNDISPRFPITTGGSSAKANVQFTSSITLATPEEKGNKAAQLEQVGRELSRRSISRVSILALALLTLTLPFAVRSHRTDSVKRQSKNPTAAQQPERRLAPATTVASESTRNHDRKVGPNKGKSRRRRDEYIAKDTYVYYGKDGKPNH